MRNHREAPFELNVSRAADRRLLSRHAVATCAVVGALAILFATPSGAVPIDRAQFDGLAARCAPSISAEVLRAVAAKESHFEPLTIHNNTKKITRNLPDAKSAIDLAQRWIAAGDSVDIGLMQINAPNLAPLGLSLEAAFEPCGSLMAAGAVLHEAYSKGASEAERQAALLIMLSRYNTGRSLNGLVNGYVGEVMTAAGTDKKPKSPAPGVVQPVKLKLESWDVWADAADARLHGASWIVDLGPSPTKPVSSSKPSAQAGNPR